MKLSIGIPTYNQVEYIEKAILSALNQTEPAYEVVVSNNHSTDSTAEILGKYKDKIRIITPPKHLTMTGNFNFLVKHLSGDWFSFISSDDYYEPDFVKIFNKNVRTDTVLMRFGFNIMNENDTIIKRNVRIRSARKLQSFPGNFYEQLTGPRIAFTAFAIKLSVFEKVGCFDDRVHINPDWTAWLKLSPKGKFQYIPETVANYRVYSRPEIVLPRIKCETIDAEIICNSIQKSIVDRYDLNVSLWKAARRVIAERKVECHRRFNLEFKYIYELYNVSEDEVKSITLVSRWILKLRELFFKF